MNVDARHKIVGQTKIPSHLLLAHCTALLCTLRLSIPITHRINSLTPSLLFDSMTFSIYFAYTHDMLYMHFNAQMKYWNLPSNQYLQIT